MVLKTKSLGKRGQGHRVVVGLVITLVAAAILIGAVWLWISIFHEKSDVELCRLTLLAQSETKIFGQSTVDATNECPVHEITFYENHVQREVDGKKDKVLVKYDGEMVEKFDRLSDDGVDSDYDNVVMQTITDEMQKCWYKVGKGEISPFDRDAFGDKNVCMLCSRFEFSNEVDRYDYQGQLNYYQSTTMLPDNSMTYTEYFKQPKYELDRVMPFIFKYKKVGDDEIYMPAQE